MQLPPGMLHETTMFDHGTRPLSGLGSRPGSSHSAPLHDVSIDHHYEFDTREEFNSTFSPLNMLFCVLICLNC